MGNFLRLSSAIVIYLFFVSSKAESESESELIDDLFDLQSQSKSGVIHLDDRSVDRFLTSTKTPRPYSLLLFFDAVQLRDKPDLRLRELSQEFAVIASSFIANHNSTNPKLFFCDIEFRESQSSFSLFGIVSLPSIFLVGPTAKSLRDDSERMEQADFTRFTDSLVDFIESRTKLTVGPLHRPPLISRTQIGILFVILLIWSPFAAKKMFSGETWLHNPRIWLSGSIFIYFFSVSGTMHTVIRRMPMFLMERDDPNRLIFFYRGTGVQLALEGLAVGFLYTIVGLLLAFVTHVLVNVKDPTAQRVPMLVSVLLSFWAVRQVILLDNWKTGYAIHGFWPSSWN